MIKEIKNLNIIIKDLDYQMAKIEVAINTTGNSLDKQEELLLEYQMYQARKFLAIKEINKLINNK
ncbi:MAG: hypothetical protein ACPKPY_02515 [Nitrososphaeraceae archaeon]